MSKIKKEIFQFNFLIDNLVSKTPHDFVPNLKYLFSAGLLLSTPYKYIFLPTINQLCQW